MSESLKQLADELLTETIRQDKYIDASINSFLIEDRDKVKVLVESVYLKGLIRGIQEQIKYKLTN